MVLIDNYRTEGGQGITRFLATVRWEDRTREPFDVSFAVQEQDTARATLNPDAFRVPAAIVALHDHEQRISGEGELCPFLRDGLENSFAWLRRWAGSSSPGPTIDLPVRCSHPGVETAASGMLLSGGVDSMAALVANHTAYPHGHERRFSVAFVVVGIQHYRWAHLDEVEAQLGAARKQLAPVGDATGVNIVPVATNLRGLNRDSWFWKYEFQGAALSGIAHLFATSLSDVAIASTWQISHLDRWGSHPLLDPGYGTHSLRIWHELAHLGRLEKTELIAQRPELLQPLNVCNERAGGDLNCGHCEKCVRTMLALESMGQLGESEAFARVTLRRDDLRGIRIGDRGLEGEYLELIEPLLRVGRPDLASAISRMVRFGRLRRSLPDRLTRSWRRVAPTAVRQWLRTPRLS